MPLVKRFAATLVGSALLVLGAAMMVLPGPGILVIVAGLAVLATEYVWAQRAVAVLGGAAIGFYDGLVGPGTGSFLVFLLVGGVGLSFLHASATAKVVNTMTNLAALLLFALGGHVLWALGAAMAAAMAAPSTHSTCPPAANSASAARLVIVLTTLAVALACTNDSPTAPTSRNTRKLPVPGPTKPS